MLSINLTLIVQLVHFFIAWWLFDKIFFKQAYQVIMHEEARDREIEEQYQAQRKLLNEKLEQREQIMVAQRQELCVTMPEILDKPIERTMQGMEISSVYVTPEQQQKISVVYAHVLIDKITEKDHRSLV